MQPYHGQWGGAAVYDLKIFSYDSHKEKGPTEKRSLLSNHLPSFSFMNTSILGGQYRAARPASLPVIYSIRSLRTSPSASIFAWRFPNPCASRIFICKALFSFSVTSIRFSRSFM